MPSPPVSFRLEGPAWALAEFMITHGFARIVSRSIGDCELLHMHRTRFDLDLARRQHADYVDALRSVGVAMEILPEETALPDACFVEDPVLVLDELAVMCRLGAASRQAETARIEANVAQVRPLRRILAPGTLEGGDVLRIGRTLYVGHSTRTNAEGIRQLAALVSPWGYRVVEVAVRRCLHLKTGVTSPADGLILANLDWVDVAPFKSFERVRVPLSEPWAGNCLPVNGTVFLAANSTQTASILVSRGLRVRLLDIGELQKAEAGLTCLSVLRTDAA